jgi:transcriptional regulator with XRE-family HTH domain
MSETRPPWDHPPEDAAWDADTVRELRTVLGLSQQAFARELGVRQQTVSDWETGTYRPRGASARVLSLVAERARIPYRAGPASSEPDAGAPPNAEAREPEGP